MNTDKRCTNTAKSRTNTRQKPTSEAKKATKILRGKTVKTVWRHRAREIAIEFTDHTRLFIDWQEGGLEISITGAEGHEEGPEKERRGGQELGG